MSTYIDFFNKIRNDITNSYMKPNKSNVLHQPYISNYGIDMHIHSKNSIDGYMDIKDIIERCMQNNVEQISVTDHNSFALAKELRKQDSVKVHPTYFEYDDVKVYTGTEVSCYMYLSRQEFVKLHVLCYGFDVDSDNIFLNMITQKGNDYVYARYYPLYYLSQKSSKYSTTLSEFKEFAKEKAKRDLFNGNLNLDETVDFYKWKGLPESETKKDLEDFDFSNPMLDKVKLDIIDVVNATHAAGGYCIVAHPIRSFEKFRQMHYKRLAPHAFYEEITNKILEIGCDGIEYANSADETSKVFNQNYSDTFLTSYGSDTHYYGPNSIHDIGKYDYDLPEASIIARLQELDSAKRNHEKTKRQKQLSKIDNQNTYIDFEDRRR